MRSNSHMRHLGVRPSSLPGGPAILVGNSEVIQKWSSEKLTNYWKFQLGSEVRHSGKVIPHEVTTMMGCTSRNSNPFIISSDDSLVAWIHDRGSESVHPVLASIEAP
jgi:hypothetical protein